MSNSLKQKIQEILDLADVKINGNRPWDIQVHNDEFYARILSGGSLAAGESYMEGWWDVEKPDEFFTKVLGAHLEHKIKSKTFIWNAIKARLSNLQSSAKAFEVGEGHYDNGNDLYKAMLDERMTYTGGMWEPFNGIPAATNLDEAQETKLEMVCQKIGLKKGDKILDIGCGWGSFMKYAYEKYGATSVGLTVSKEQAEFGEEMCKGLPIEFRLIDYRDIDEKFDHIVSLGMFEHVGYKNYQEFFKIAEKNLKDDGYFLLHTIGIPTSSKSFEPWIEKYIFPNGQIPSMKQITKAIENIFIIEDWHNFSINYDPTLMAWYENFKNKWPELENKYGEKYNGKFFRMWEYYLLSCAGAFRARRNQLWQIVLRKNGLVGGYKSIR